MSGKKPKPKSLKRRLKHARGAQGELEAKNLSLWVEVWVKKVQLALLNGAVGTRPNEEDLQLLWAGWHEKLWLHQLDPKSVKPFTEFVDFCLAPRPDGLGTEPDSVMMFLAHDVLPSVRDVDP